MGTTAIHILHKVVLPAVALATLLSSSSCMLSPYDGQRVDSKSSVVTFWGYHLNPDTVIEIQALDPQGKDWEQIGTARSSFQVSLQATGGVDLYGWQKHLAIPSKYWEPGGTGYRTQVRAVIGTMNLMSVEADWYQCYVSSKDIAEFAADCAAPQSPVARVYTKDYQLSQVPNNSYCSSVASWSGTSAQWEQEVLTLVNQQRAKGATCGGQTYGPAPPLTMDPALRCAARKHSKDMSDRGFFNHTNPDGDGPGDRIRKAGYNWYTWGENIAGGYSSPAAVVQGWMTSSGHCRNIMSSNFKHIGVGHYKNHWTQVFGAR